jgi:hypothetical protein
MADALRVGDVAQSLRIAKLAARLVVADLKVHRLRARQRQSSYCIRATLAFAMKIEWFRHVATLGMIQTRYLIQAGRARAAHAARRFAAVLFKRA